MNNRQLPLKISCSSAIYMVVSVILAYGQTGSKPDPYDNLHTEKYMGDVEVVARIHDEQVFTEGPAVDREGNVYFTNIPVSKILKWDPENKKLSSFRNGSNNANGLRFTMKGELLVCEGQPARLTSTNMITGKVKVLADQYNGLGFQSLNDLDCRTLLDEDIAWAINSVFSLLNQMV